MDDTARFPGPGRPSVQFRRRNASLPPLNELESGNGEKFDVLSLSNRRTRSEPTDYDAFIEEETTDRRRSAKNPAANFAKWIMTRLGGTKGIRYESDTDDGELEHEMLRAKGKIDTLQDRMRKAQSRIRGLERDLSDRKSKQREDEKLCAKTTEDLESQLHNLTAEKKALMKASGLAADAVDGAQEHCLCVQSQIRVFGVLLNEEMMRPLEVEERIKWLVQGLEEVGTDLREAGVLLTHGEVSGTGKELSVFKPEVKLMDTCEYEKGQTLEEVVDVPTIPDDLDDALVRSQLLKLVEQNRDLKEELEGAKCANSQLKYECSKLRNKCIALEQGMTLIGGRLNESQPAETVEPEPSQGEDKTESSTEDDAKKCGMGICKGCILQEVGATLWTVLHQLGQAGCWIHPGKDIEDVRDLMSELQTAVTSGVHRIHLLERHERESFAKANEVTLELKRQQRHMEDTQQRNMLLEGELERVSQDLQLSRLQMRDLFLTERPLSAQTDFGSHPQRAGSIEGPFERLTRGGSAGPIASTGNPFEDSRLHLNHEAAPQFLGAPGHFSGLDRNTASLDAPKATNPAGFLEQRDGDDQGIGLATHQHAHDHVQGPYDEEIPVMITDLQAKLASLEDMVHEIEHRGRAPSGQVEIFSTR